MFIARYGNLITELNSYIQNYNGVSLYPNPTSGTFTISYSQLSTPNSQLIIEDVLGRTVYTQPITNPTQSTIQLNQLLHQLPVYLIQ